MLDEHPRVDGPRIEMIEFLNLVDDVILDRLRHFQIMSRQNQFHAPR